MDNEEKIDKFLENLNKFSDSKIKFKDVLSELFIIADKYSKQPLIKDIAFHSKFAWKTLNIMKSNSPETEGLSKVQDEFGSGVEKISNLLKDIISNENEEYQIKFNDQFLDQTPEAFQNLLELIYDFSWIKNWLLENNDVLW